MVLDVFSLPVLLLIVTGMMIYLQIPRSLLAGSSKSCDICGKVFSQRCTMLMHRRSMHLGIFPYKCQICGKGYVSKVNLDGHMTIHTGERTFKCIMCLKEFQYKASLEKHVKTLHPEQKSNHCR
jgi:KRAB domain-containing zinc finger protein